MIKIDNKIRIKADQYGFLVQTKICDTEKTEAWDTKYYTSLTSALEEVWKIRIRKKINRKEEISISDMQEWLVNEHKKFWEEIEGLETQSEAFKRYSQIEKRKTNSKA